MALEEHYKELELSTFSKPILKEMGIKALFLVTFDIIIGPIAYICQLTPGKIEYLEFLKDLAHLGEFYTGISHGQIDKVTTRTGEELLVGRTIRKINETELIDVAVALVENTDYQAEIIKMLKFAVRTAYGKPSNFSKLIDKVCLEFQGTGKKETTKVIKSVFKDLSKGKQQNVAKLFENWFGILFVDFEGQKINSSFLPDWIEANKIVPSDIAVKVKTMYAEGIIIPKTKQSFTMVSLKGRQAIVVSTTNLRFCSIIFPTQLGLTRINAIVEEMDSLTDAMADVGLDFGNEPMKKTLQILDERVVRKNKDTLLKAALELMIKADSLAPKALISVENYKILEGEFQQKFFNKMVKAYKEFDGVKTILAVAHKFNISLDQMADFVVFCKTRGIVQVFAKNGRQG
ncbi:MAG: hypothetical protein DRO63_08925 [Candidatus Gerdarchaeota archaeon]|nr:MAG: hypothetical protein DRO63_08925 [Candidatus Gerdarchaeota archaeon]